jgi:Domain of Unknown Function (DUF1206)
MPDQVVSRVTRRRTRIASRAGQRASGGRYVELLARSGLAARGVMYAIVGWLAIQIAFGRSGRQADQTGAVRLVASTPFGAVALWLLVAGFVGMTIWRLSEALYGGPGSSGRGATARLTALGKAVLYGFIVYGVLKFALGLGAPASSDKESVDLTAAVMRQPGGRVIVGLAGLAFVAAGAGLAYRAWQKEFLKEFRLAEMTPRLRRLVVALGQGGGIARGTVFAAAGVFLMVAALDASPGKAKGLDATLRALATTPAGPWLLVIVAAGLITFGAFSCAEARWRRFS